MIGGCQHGELQMLNQLAKLGAFGGILFFGFHGVFQCLQGKERTLAQALLVNEYGNQNNNWNGNAEKPKQYRTHDRSPKIELRLNFMTWLIVSVLCTNRCT
jgi:hypothetical protein